MAGKFLLIFDLDGTLYRTESSFLPTMHRIYDEYGVPRPDDGEILAQVGETYTTFLEWLVPQGFPEDVEAVGRRITEIEFAAIVTDGALFDGVADGLRMLREDGNGIALCTNGDRRYAEHVLGAHGILTSFDVLQTNDDDRRAKAEMVAELLERLGPRTAVMVGDRYHDLEAGTRNGCVTVGAAYGYARPGELDGATHVIDRFGDLLPLVRRIRESA
jgi:phosphoglycolate phosphatase-like HAD superfamily hydrolase